MLQAELEKDINLMAVTAIEDKLQENVEDTITSLKATGMKVWVLTGDKTETAINIGHSSHLIGSHQQVFVVDLTALDQFNSYYSRLEAAIKRQGVSGIAIVITGFTIDILRRDQLLQLLKVCYKTDCVIVSRSTPKQKKEVI